MVANQNSMARVSAKWDQSQLNALRLAVSRNPAKIRAEAADYFTRGLRVYNTIILRSPWRMGSSGGGAPVSPGGGHLRDTHAKEIRPWEAIIKPTATYAPYVHGIKGFPRKRSYQLRPWLDYAQRVGDSGIRELEQKLFDNIVKDLAR